MSNGDGAEPLTIDDLRRPRQNKPLRELPGVLAGAITFVWRSSRGGATLLAVTSIAQSLLTIGMLGAGARLVSRVQQLDHGDSVSKVVPPLAVFVVCMVMQALAGAVAREVRMVLAERTSSRAQRIVAGAATRAPLIAYEGSAFHDRLQRSLANSAARPLQVTTAVATLVSSIVVAVGLVVAVAVLQPLVLAVITAGIVPLWFVTRRITRIGYEFALIETEEDRRRGYLLHLMTAKEAAQELRAYQWADRLSSRHESLWESRIERVLRFARRRLRMSVIGAAINGLMVAGVVVLLAWTVAAGRADLATAGAVGAAVLLLGGRLSLIAGSIGALYECALFLIDVDKFTGAYPAGAEIARPPAAPFASSGVLRAEGLSFSYPSGSRPALDDVALEVHSGELIALVGPNGSGKTTLAKLLAGLLPPTAGAVSWNSTPVHDGDETWHDQVAVVFQDHLKFFMPLRENVGLGRVTTAPTDAAVLGALGQAGLGRMVDGLPKGIDSLLGPQFYGGTDLSGGQWQRVALARAFFRDAAVVILDEPSSALDPDAEAALFDTVRELCAGRAVVVISHRFSTVTHADRIYVFADGKLVEHGSHTELLAGGGEYARMFQLQASRYQSPTVS